MLAPEEIAKKCDSGWLIKETTTGRRRQRILYDTTFKKLLRRHDFGKLPKEIMKEVFGREVLK